MALFKRKGIDLSTFVSGIVRALTRGQQALPAARMEQINKHFEKDESTGVYTPVTHVFQISESQTVTIPTWCLSRVNQIGIDSALIRCSAKIVDINLEELECNLSSADKQVDFYVQPSTPDNKSFEIEIKFNRRMNTETENKLDEFLRSTVEVQTVDTNQDD